ncbi:MAG: WYL domain-containing protein, partial [Clostridia bacterium]|nr:WYL domain-containing protein [Clostridia bacterium]
ELLALLEIFRRYTEDNHPLSTNSLIAWLKNYGISAERKAIYQDLELLRTYGYDIISVNHPKTAYYLGERKWEETELRLLADAVGSSRFITKRKSESLIQKLTSELSDYQAAKIRRQVHVGNRVKNMNESIYYSVDKIHSAILKNRVISFSYFDWNVRKEKVLRHEGKKYAVSPWALLWEEENYYLIGYDGEARCMKHYRVDKMQTISVTDAPREGEQAFAEINLEEYSSAVFGMFGGTPADVVLKAENGLSGVVIDRFGRDVSISICDETHFLCHVRVNVSPTFFAWAPVWKLYLPYGLKTVSCLIFPPLQNNTNEGRKRYAVCQRPFRYGTSLFHRS